MGEKLYWHPNTMVIPLGQGLYRLFQVTTRRNVLASRPILELIDVLVGGADKEAVTTLYAAMADRLRVADATEFTLWENAYVNSDFFSKETGAGDLEWLPFDEFLDLFTECGIISASWPPPFDNKKRSFGDRFKGRFYEQIGTEALFHRTTPVQWWTSQKFTEDLLETRPTPYRFIEEQFLDDYFAKHLGGKEVLEIGCGTGYFTRKMAKHSRLAVGMDYNPEYVAAAKEKWPSAEYPNLEFHVGDIIDLAQGSGLLQQRQFDRVWLIDTFLFLFDDVYQAHLYQHRDQILRNITALLKDDGQLLVLDPHPLWLTPWLGLPERPFGILTEYRTRSFKVIPSLQEMTTFLFEGGLRIRRILEPDVHEDLQAIDPAAYHFMKQIPQWWFFEIEKAL